MDQQLLQEGLYDPRFEHDACGVAFVADLKRGSSHEIVDLGLTALENLAHRGAFGADPETGDGAGILIQMPDEFLRAVIDFELPPAGAYASGLAFLPLEERAAAASRAEIERISSEEGLVVLGWRVVPVDLAQAGKAAKQVAPRFEQLFVASSGAGGAGRLTDLELDRVAFIARKRIEHELGDTYFPSLSSRTFIYKGMLSTEQLRRFFPDLSDDRMTSALALVHSRFSTNTFPSWPLAHPYRLIAHNGEINTVQGNKNWMRSREALLASTLFHGDLRRLMPVVTQRASDSASFDEVVELLHLGGRSLPHAILMMIPEAWENHTEMDSARKAFYQYHGCLMEPWDGPAAVAFTDGEVIGAVLDRNGLRPARYWVRDDGLVVLASEVGVLEMDPSRIVRKGRLQPGRMFLCDLTQRRIIDDNEIKAGLAAQQPYAEWLEHNLVSIDDLAVKDRLVPQYGSLVTQQRLFGYTLEELRIILAPMARTGAEPTGSMGSDTPIAVLSERARLLFDYFSQLFAQVTNPPLDAIREELVTSLANTIGPEQNLLDPTAASCRQIVVPYPVIDNDELAKILHINDDGALPGFSCVSVPGLYEVAGGGRALRAALDKVCSDVATASIDGSNIVVLSDRHANANLAPIPSLLLTSAVHHYLVRERLRARTGLVIETGEAREVHHMALLIGFGAAAVNPYLALETVAALAREGELGDLSEYTAVQNYVKAAGKGVLKVMSKMGISTIASYTGAQVFEAVGLSRDVVDRYFTGVTSHLGGANLDVLASEVEMRHHLAFEAGTSELAGRDIEVGGEYQWRREGEHHLFNPKTVFKLQHATRSKRYEIFKEYTTLVDEQSERLATLRGLLRFKVGDASPRSAIPIDEVEPVEAIVKRF